MKITQYAVSAVITIFLTVKAALQIGAFKKCTLLAGSSGLERDVSYISSMEVPNVKAWAVSKQLLITTAYSIRNSPELLAEIIKDLSDAGASGLGVKTKFIGEIPLSIIDLADALKMPLIHIPEHVLFVDLIVPIMKAIINEQNEVLEFSEKIYAKLIELNLTEGGLANISDFIFTSIGTPVAIMDSSFAILSTNSSKRSPVLFADVIQEQVVDISRFSVGRELITTLYTKEKTIYILRKIVIKNKICGYILLCADKKRLNETSLIVVEHAATFAALEFAKIQALQQQVKMMENNFYIDLLTESVRNEEEAYYRANNLSWPKLPISLIVFNIDNFEQMTNLKDEAAIFQMKDSIRQVITNCFKTIGKNTPIMLNSDSFSCIISGNYAKEALKNTIEITLQAVLAKTNLQLTAGICEQIKNYTDLKIAENDAVEAIYVCRREERAEKFIFAESIKLQKALLTVIDSPHLRAFIDSTIGKLLDFDKKNNAQLTHTLDELIKCMGVKAKTAENLYIHRNTLTQRLKKIESIIGYDLSRSSDLLDLGIAMKIRKLLD